MVDKVLLAAFVTVVGGGLVALQPPINAKLGSAVGSLPAAATSFGVGFLSLLLLALAFGPGSIDASEASRLSWYYLIGGGVIGAAYVTIALVTVPRLGAAGVTAATVAGQLTASVLADRFGVFGLAERPLSVSRMLGIALLALGVILIVRPE